MRARKSVADRRVRVVRPGAAVELQPARHLDPKAGRRGIAVAAADREPVEAVRDRRGVDAKHSGEAQEAWLAGRTDERERCGVLAREALRST